MKNFYPMQEKTETKVLMFGMKSILMLILFVFLTEALWAQNDTIPTKNKEEENIKKGWTFGGLPILSFDSDLGAQLGALAGIYHYGDGSRYPMYDHYIYLEASFYTKGSALFRFYYDSDRLIKGIRVTADVTYLPDPHYDFLGFNGYESVYNTDWVEDSTRIFYEVNRKMFRTMLNFQGKLFSKSFRWIGGMDFYNLDYNNVDVDKINRNKEGEDRVPSIDSMPGLYERYKQWGLIGEDEANGGLFTAIKAGLILDTRDNEPNPTRGLFTEVVFAGAPKFLSTMNTGFLKLSVIHRQYFSLIKKRLIFAYRLGFQATIAGTAPWYTENILYPTYLRGASSEGLGGAKTVRGIIRNRVVGDGIGYGNFEFRWKIWKTVFLNQNLYFALSGFFDSGRVLIPMKEEEIDQLPEDVKAKYFTDKESFHNTVGGGFHIAMNENFMLSVDIGKALDKRDGNMGVYIGLGFLF